MVLARESFHYLIVDAVKYCAVVNIAGVTSRSMKFLYHRLLSCIGKLYYISLWNNPHSDRWWIRLSACHLFLVIVLIFQGFLPLFVTDPGLFPHEAAYHTHGLFCAQYLAALFAVGVGFYVGSIDGYRTGIYITFSYCFFEYQAKISSNNSLEIDG